MNGGWYAPLPDSNPGFQVQQNSLRDAKPFSVKAVDGKLSVKLEPKSVTVLSVEQ
jgi:hypothetical protein